MNQVVESLREMYNAMLRYQDAADCDSPRKHRDMMDRAKAALDAADTNELEIYRAEVDRLSRKLVAVQNREREAARLNSIGPELLEALERLRSIHRPITGNPSHEELVAFWEYEKSQGRGEADDQLFVLAAIAKAKGTK